MSKRLNLSKSEINSLYPICGATVFYHGLVLHRCSNLRGDELSHARKRGTVDGLSNRSRLNFALTVRRMNVKFLSLLTLTYGQNFPINGKQVKADWNAFITALRREFGPVKYFWFMEFQERGAPHLHVGLNIGPPLLADRVVMADIWCRIAERYDFLYSPWKPQIKHPVFSYGLSTRDAVRAVHEYPDAWEEIRETDGALRYIACYATKPYQKVPPFWFGKVGRFWGVSRVMGKDEGVRYSATEGDVREVLKALGRDFDSWELLPKVILY